MIDIDEVSCETAAIRMQKLIAQGRLFEPEEIEQPKQETMQLACE